MGMILAKLGLAHGAISWPASYETILFQLRLPRVVLTALVGGALAVSGAAYQGVFRNPLADPYLIGVAAGAGLGATVALVIPYGSVLASAGLVPLLAQARQPVGTSCNLSLPAWGARCRGRPCSWRVSPSPIWRRRAHPS